MYVGTSNHLFLLYVGTRKLLFFIINLYRMYVQSYYTCSVQVHQKEA